MRTCKWRICGIMILCISLLFSLGCAQSTETKTLSGTIGPIKYTEILGIENVERIRTIYEGILCYCVNGYWGAIDIKGNTICNPQWDDMTTFSEGLAGVKKNGKWGLIDRNGEIVVEPVWENMAGSFSEGLRAVKYNGKWGFINTETEYVLMPRWESAHNFNEGLAAVCIYDRWGYIDYKGNYVIKPKWKGGWNNSDTSTKETDNMKGHGGNTGEYNDAGDFYEGYATVVEENKTIIIDRTGKEIIALDNYASIGFTEGLAMVRNKKEGIGFIDNKGQYVIEINSAWNGDCAGFNEGVAPMQEVTRRNAFSYNYKAYYIDQNGKRTGKTNWTYLSTLREGVGFAYDSKQNAYVYVDRNGEKILRNTRFLAVTFFENGYAACIDTNHRIVILDKNPIDWGDLSAIMSVKINDDGSVNVRSEGSTKGERVGVASAGSVYPCVGVADTGWYQIMLEDGTTGYISNKKAKEVEGTRIVNTPVPNIEVTMDEKIEVQTTPVPVQENDDKDPLIEIAEIFSDNHYEGVIDLSRLKEYEDEAVYIVRRNSMICRTMQNEKPLKFKLTAVRNDGKTFTSTEIECPENSDIFAYIDPNCPEYFGVIHIDIVTEEDSFRKTFHLVTSETEDTGNVSFTYAGCW